MIFSWIVLVILLTLVNNNSLLVYGENTKDDPTDGGRLTQTTVETSLGTVIGLTDGNIKTFLGVPYAEPPTGRFRFRPSRPKRPWYPSTYKAFSFSPECLHSTLYSIPNSIPVSKDEDCLYLNIWTPANFKYGQLYPVMVWVYGGGFIQGSASKAEYIGSTLAARDVIVVSFNYRLGALGFLVSTIDGLYGNYGLHDQKLALQWVQDHIKGFGGDPDRVTLFGESAGAMSIGLHLLDKARSSKQSARLFHAVILQSNPLGYKYRSVTVANFIGAAFKEQLDCEDLHCLQSESADELIHVQDTLMAVPRSIGDFFTWGPVITDSSYQREARLRPGPLSNVTVRQPLQALRDLRRLDVPVIIGSNSHEGIVFVFTAFPTRMPKPLYQALVVSFFRTHALQILKLYSPLTDYISESPYPDYRVVLSTIIGDYLFRCPNQLFARQLSNTGAPVFLYEFSLPTRTPGYPCCDGLACHTAELPYVFNQLKVIDEDYAWYDPSPIPIGPEEQESSDKKNSFFQDIFGATRNVLGMGGASTFQHQDTVAQRLAIDKKVSDLMADYWTTFVTNGDPNGLPTRTGYINNPRHASSPLWPQIMGKLPSLFAIDEHKLKKMANELHLSTIEAMSATVSDPKTSNVQFMESNDDEFDDEKTIIEKSRGQSSKQNKGNIKSRSSGNKGQNSIQGITNKKEKSANNRNIIGNNSVLNDNIDEDTDNFITYPSFSAGLDQEINPYSYPSDIIESMKGGFDESKFRGKKGNVPTSSSPSMHVLTFDENTAVYLVENDCICNVWNKLNYVF